MRFRQFLVLLPFGLFLLRQQGFGLFEIFARGKPLLGRQLGPAGHARLHPFLFFRVHRRIFLRQREPFFAAKMIQLVPLAGEGFERFLLFGIEGGPARLRWCDRQCRPG